MLSAAAAREREPEVSCLAALHVESTGITDFGAVCEVLAGLVREHGGEVRLGTRVTALNGGVRTADGEQVPADLVINCAGLFSDRLAGKLREVRIVPFRGEYFHVRRPLVRTLVYPVPDPALPFLGVHLTRGIDGSLHAGPNAVLALAREGYTWRRFSARDLAAVAGYPGMWRLARKHLRTGIAEVRRSLSRSGIREGVGVVYCPHTSAAVTVNEAYDPDVVHDMLLWFERVVPKDQRGWYRRSGRPTWSVPRPGYGHRRSGATARCSTTSYWSGDPVRYTCSTHRHRRRPVRWRSPGGSSTGCPPEP